MSEDERMELGVLRPDDAARERVVRGAMARIRRRSVPGPATLALTGSARYLAPVLAAAAVVSFLLLVRATGVEPDREVQGAGVLLEAAGNIPDPWLRWSLTDAEPDPREVLVMFAETP